MKKTKVYWTISPLTIPPSVIYENPIKYPTLAKCPVVGEQASRTRLLLSPYEVKIQPNFMFNEVEQREKFTHFNASSNDVVDEFLFDNETITGTHPELWTNQNEPQFQIVMPYIFVSEEDIEMSLIGLQSSETKSKLDNLKFIEAVLPINQMARPLSSAWSFTSKDEAHFIKGQPHMKLIFSKPVELHYFTPGPLFKHWDEVNNGFVNYQKHGTKRKFKNILSRRPKNLFKEIKQNIEYGEA